MEVWKEIPGYEGYYSASNYGRIRRDYSTGEYKKGMILRNTLKNTGYYRTAFCINKKRAYFGVHSIVMLTFFGPRLEGMTINHKDGNKLNNFFDNLEYMTKKENIRHAFRIGLRKPSYGSENNLSKLNEEMVLSIRKEYLNSDTTHQKLSDKYGTARANITRIINRQIWKHI